jgi:hypothetical protein
MDGRDLTEEGCYRKEKWILGCRNNNSRIIINIYIRMINELESIWKEVATA